MLITVKDNEIAFSGIHGKYAVENIYEQYADEILYFRTEGTHKATFTIDRILPLVKALKPITEAITLELSNDIPLRITSELPIDGHLIYYLAPCVDYKEKDPEPEADQDLEEAAPEVVDVDVIDPYEDEPELYPTYSEAVIDFEGEPVEIPAVEAAPDPQEDMSLGELYLKYYAEALARHTAEAA